MKKLLLGGLLLLSMLTLESCSSDSIDSTSTCEWVNGYTKANGTYVNGYWRNCN